MVGKRDLSDSDAEDDHDTDEDQHVSSKKKKTPKVKESTSSKKKRTRQAPEPVEDDGDSTTGDHVQNGTGSMSTPSDSKPTFSTNVTLHLDGRLKRKVGAPSVPPRYVSSSKSNSVAQSLSTEDLRSVVSATTRLVLARQLNGKPLTGTEIATIALSKLAGTSDKKDFNKLLLGYIRVEVAKRLKDVFGFELFAGDGELGMSDRWYIVNALENDELKLLVGTNPADLDGSQADEDDDAGNAEHRDKVSEELDRMRGALMIVLAVIMMNKDEIQEDNLQSELQKFGFSMETATRLKSNGNPNVLSIPDVLQKLKKQGFVVKDKQVYRMGDKALNEIGKRNVLLFMTQSCNFQLEEHEEEALLRISTEDAA